MFKGIIFDIGRTLVGYNKPLSWSTLYLPALQNMAGQCHYNLSEDQYKRAIDILTKYNTRIHPRIHMKCRQRKFLRKFWMPCIYLGKTLNK